MSEFLLALLRFVVLPAVLAAIIVGIYKLGVRDGERKT